MTAFDVAVAAVLASEGLWSNDPDDSGRKTKYGITEATLHDAIAQAVVPAVRIEDLTEGAARRIYREMYWDEVKADYLPPWLAFVMFDMAVNPGPGAAVLMLQKALGVKADGIIGPKTLAAAKAAKPDAQDRLLALRAQYYFQRVIEKPVKKKFLDGWLVRCCRIAREAGGL